MSKKRKISPIEEEILDDDISLKLKEFQFERKKTKINKIGVDAIKNKSIEKTIVINLPKNKVASLKDKKAGVSDEEEKSGQSNSFESTSIKEIQEREKNPEGKNYHHVQKQEKLQVILKRTKTLDSKVTQGKVHMVKKLNRNRSMMENLLDNYISPDRIIELGDGKINEKEILIATWNLNGLNAILNKDSDSLVKYMEDRKPHILCLNETKLTDDNCLEIGTQWIPEGYYSYFNCCKIKRGYAGTAIISKFKPISVTFDLGIRKHGLEGRTITTEFEYFYLVATYVPNAGANLVGLSYRTEEWDPDLRVYVNELKKKKNVILSGDLNCAHQEIDIYDPKGKEKAPCFTPQERKRFGELITSGFVDIFRHMYPDKKTFSFFSQRFNSREQYKGWRLDYFLVNKEGVNAVKDCIIQDKIIGSDHVPVEILLDAQFGKGENND